MTQRILDAEQRLVATAGAGDGPVVDESAVDLALLEMAANETALDAGQAWLVRQMCTSDARLQLAIAPAGAGKTTAMRALTLAWTQDGGQVLGLAPSAAVLTQRCTGPGQAVRRTHHWCVSVPRVSQPPDQ
jgi:ATP-dependent exoDNAse (exonuclease V) alpha subunit